MTGRFFLGNFDFEHRLSEPTYEPSAKLKRLNAELSTSWLSVAQDGDWIWTPSPIDSQFFEEAARQGLPRVIPVTSFTDVPKGVECVPWGWSSEVRRLAARYGWIANSPTESAVRLANSRETSEELERRFGVAIPNARKVETFDELKVGIRSLSPSDDRWVVKAEFSMSARERILGRGAMREADENWVRRRLSSSGFVFFEPWVDRFAEIGIQIDIPKFGEPTLIGLAPMLVDGRGQYAGSWFAYTPSRLACDEQLSESAIEVALRAAKELQNLGYFGPLGVDAMIYRDSDGEIRLRPLQDINARWTMGRLSLEWKRLLQQGEEGCWQHGSVVDLPVETGLEIGRIIMTSPHRMGGVDCHHGSRLLVMKQ